ncbi:MAG: glycosyltransferase family 4 protein [Calditrichaeota bacterium]|nr:glycosyltransferase family 4 protein [Calditrichota bacterium]
MQKNVPEILFISWAPYCSRSDNIARELGGKSYMVYYEFLGSNYFTILLKYLAQTIASLVILLRDRPDVVFVMSPPIIACVPALIYCKLFGKQYGIDSHTGAFLNPRWKKTMFLHKFFSKHAVTTIVTNTHLENILKEWSVPSFLMQDVKVKKDNIDIPTFSANFNITLVNSFATDEPLDNFLEAVSNIKEAHFHITGKITSKNRHLLNSVPSNITFTDFLSDEKYFGLLKTSDIVIALTTKDHTMQRGAYEAVYMGTPVITSNWGVLKENFYKGAIFVDNSVDGIKSGIYMAFEEIEKLKKEVSQLKEEKMKMWEEKKVELLNTINNK